MDGAASGLRPDDRAAQVRQLGTFATKRAATELAKSVSDGRVGSADETVEPFLVTTWRASRAVDARPVPLGGQRPIIPLLGAVRLRDLTPELVDEWIPDLSSAPEGEKPRLGATSTRLVRKVPSMALEEAL